MVASMDIVQEILSSFNQSTAEVKMEASGQQASEMGPCGARKMRPSKKTAIRTVKHGGGTCFKKK